MEIDFSLLSNCVDHALSDYRSGLINGRKNRAENARKDKELVKEVQALEVRLGKLASMARRAERYQEILVVMLNPENRPPQFSEDEAWRQYLAIEKT